MESMKQVATSLLKKAVEMDVNKQYTMALILYQEGTQALFNLIKETKCTKNKKYLIGKATDYLNRAEKLKEQVKMETKSKTYRELIKIEDNATGYSYNTIFSKFLDSTVTHIHIEDPYIRYFHQCQNLVRFCELVVQNCQFLSKITLITTYDTEDRASQIAKLQELKKSLATKVIVLDITFSDTLHDRQIIISNGWIIKIGRGLDYFKAPEGKFSLGSHDLELRPCQQTTVDIFHKSQLGHV